MSYPQGPPPGQQPGAPWPPAQPVQPYPPQPYPQQAYPPQQWDQRRAHPHPEPRSYPLVLRTWSYRWWKPLVGIAFAVAALLVVQTVLLSVLAIGVVVDGGSGTFADRFTEATDMETVTPWSMLYVNLGLASLTLITWLVVRVVHNLRPRWLSSVLPGMRWKFFFACLGLAVIALGASLLVGLVLPEDPNSLSGTPHAPTGQLLATAIVILVTTPLQALGEEYGFRGYLMQAFGSLFRSRTAAVVITALLFAIAHGGQNFPLFFDRFAFGLMAGLVVVLVGGLEAGIALHILNNLLAFGVAVAFNQLDGALLISEASWWQLPVTIVQNGVFLVLVLWLARRMGLRNTTAPPAVEERADDAPQPVV